MVGALLYLWLSSKLRRRRYHCCHGSLVQTHTHKIYYSLIMSNDVKRKAEKLQGRAYLVQDVFYLLVRYKLGFSEGFLIRNLIIYLVDNKTNGTVLSIHKYEDNFFFSFRLCKYLNSQKEEIKLKNSVLRKCRFQNS